MPSSENTTEPSGLRISLLVVSKAIEVVGGDVRLGVVPFDPHLFNPCCGGRNARRLTAEKRPPEQFEVARPRWPDTLAPGPQSAPSAPVRDPRSKPPPATAQAEHYVTLYDEIVNNLW